MVDIQMQNNYQNMNQENQKKKMNGRWTRAENEKFLNALEKYGRNWGKIQKKVKTRTLPQIRSHAQKMFIYMTDPDANISPPQKSEGKTTLRKSERKNILKKEQSKLIHQEKNNISNEKQTESGSSKGKMINSPVKAEPQSEQKQKLSKPLTFCLTLPQRRNIPQAIAEPFSVSQPQGPQFNANAFSQAIAQHLSFLNSSPNFLNLSNISNIILQKQLLMRMTTNSFL